MGETQATSLNEKLRSLPSVDDVLAGHALTSMTQSLPHSMVLDAARASIEAARNALISGENIRVNAGILAEQARNSLEQTLAPSLRRVINATGVIVHTNLGRSSLAEQACQAVLEAAKSYSTLEYDVQNMQRGSRHAHCEKLICALTGAEAAIAVNNNAAAVMMVLSEFAAGHEAVVSRGELVEIGGSFRVPDIMELSNAKMVEVGTTNKTHVFDYERAVTDNTAMLLKVHTSNYRLVGFTESVTSSELHDIARGINDTRIQAGNHYELLVYEDLGSGALIDIDCNGESPEPTVASAIAQGCDLVSFSGDKLLGGPQAGIIVGSKKLIDRLKKHPLARALRLDKMTLAALEATLRIYLDPDKARQEIPTLRMLSAPADEVKKTADKLADLLKSDVADSIADITVVPEISRAGGGALPMYDIDSFAVRIDFKTGNAQECSEYLIRQNDVPVVGRIKQDSLLFDTRTIVQESELGEIAAAVNNYFTQAVQK